MIRLRCRPLILRPDITLLSSISLTTYCFLPLYSTTTTTTANMGTASLLSADDKAKVKKAIPTSSSTNKIVAGAVARVYVAKAGAST